MDKGSLYQLRNLLGRTHVTKKVKANVFAAEDLLEVVTQGHVIAAAMHVKQVAQLDDLVFVREENISLLSQQIVDELLRPIFFGDENLTSDGINLHARELMLMGLLWYSFRDAISEGDGPAVMSYWKVMTIMFRLTGHKK